MNYGRSLNARAAIGSRRAGPASVVARWIRNGITAAWIRQTCATSEWHHTQAGLGGDGRPTDFYDTDDVLAAWLAANMLARTARVPSLRALRLSRRCPAYLVRSWLECRPALPAKNAASAPDPLVGRTVRIRRRVLVRQRSRRQRYVAEEHTVSGTVSRVTDTYLIFADGQRIGRKTILSQEIA